MRSRLVAVCTVLLLGYAEGAGAGCAPNDARDYYFPYSAQVRPEYELYSFALRELGEPSLRCQEEDRRTVRLLHFPTFAEPTVVRVWVNREESNVEVAYFADGKITRQSRGLASNEWAELESVAADARFWSLPQFVPPEYLAFDTPYWLIELSVPGGYRAISRLSLEEPAFKRLAAHLASLGGQVARLMPNNSLQPTAPKRGGG